MNTALATKWERVNSIQTRQIDGLPKQIERRVSIPSRFRKLLVQQKHHVDMTKKIRKETVIDWTPNHGITDTKHALTAKKKGNTEDLALLEASILMSTTVFVYNPTWMYEFVYRSTPNKRKSITDHPKARHRQRTKVLAHILEERNKAQA